jgi:protein SCO1/2
MRQRIIIVVGVAVMLAVAALRTTRSAPVADSNRKGAAYFSNVELITQDGAKVRFYDDLLKGKIVVIDLFYTQCLDSCPLETARLAQVQRMLGDRVGRDIFFYSISIDPWRDTPAQLKAYAEKYRIGPGWLFLTGNPQDIDLISKRLGLYTEPVDRDGHAPAVLLGNEPAGQWIRNAAIDNPRRLAVVIGDWLNSWQSAKKGTSFAEVPTLSLDNKGQYLFATQCAACHSIGHGDRIGPDLQGITDVRDAAWVKRFIATPDKVLAEKDALATALFEKYDQVIMPNLRLADADVNALLEFLAKGK